MPADPGRRLKIAVWHNLPSGGGKRALHDHVRGLIGRGHTVEAWCPPTADPGYLPLSPMVPEHVVALDWPAPTLGDKLQVTLGINRQIAAMDAHSRACAKQIAQGGFDVLFANTCRFFRAPMIGRHARLPSVLYLQEPYRWLYEALPRLPWLALAREDQPGLHPSTWRAAFLDWRTVRNARVQAREEVASATAFTRILVNSYFSRESVLRAYGLDAQVCYLGVDHRHFVDHGLPREDIVAGLGSVTPEKNLHLVIEAIGALPLPRPRLVWIGNIALPSYQADMEALAATRGVVLDLQIGISDIEVVALLNRVALMVYAPRLEPFGLAPLEANSCGVPVVATREGGMRETVRDGVNGIVTDANPAALAVAIARLRCDPALARELGGNGRRMVVTNWSLDAATIRLEEELMHCTRAVENDRRLPDANPP